MMQSTVKVSRFHQYANFPLAHVRVQSRETFVTVTRKRVWCTGSLLYTGARVSGSFG